MRSVLVAAVAIPVLSMQAHGADTLVEFGNGGEIRLSTSYGWERRAEVLQLRPDGTVSGVYETSRQIMRGNTYRRSGHVAGRWRLEAGRLCVEGKGFAQPGRNCYAVTKSGYSEREFSGVEETTGQIWQMFIYPGGR